MNKIEIHLYAGSFRETDCGRFVESNCSEVK